MRDEPDHHDRAEERARPARCRGAARANSAIRIDDGERQRRNARRPASTSFRPSTADSTEIAGVITESPKNSAAPMMPSMQHQRRAPAERAVRQRHQRQRAALAVIVGAQQDQHVFDA